MFQFNQIEKPIQKKLFKRMDALSRQGDYAPLDPMVEKVDNAVSEIFSKTCWVKVTSATTKIEEADDGTKKIMKGEPTRLSGAFKKGQPLNRAVTSRDNINNNRPNSTHRPYEGITGVTTAFKGSYGIQNVTINFKVWDMKRFEEIYQPAFLTHGKTILVEFGWGTHSQMTPTTTAQGKTQLEYYENIQKKILEANGDYYAAVGTVQNYSWSIGTNGEFDCSVTLTSMGHTLFKGPTNTSTDDGTAQAIKDLQSKEAEEAFEEGQAKMIGAMENFDDYLKTFIDKDDRVYYNSDNGKAWCSWGFFEDTILNTFFGTTSKKFADGEVVSENDLTTFIQSKGFRYQSTPGDEDTFEKIDGDSKCRNSSKNLYTKSIHVIIPEKIEGLSTLKDIGESGAYEIGGEEQIIEDEEMRKKYKNLYQTFSDIKDQFDTFKDSEDSEKGIIRNFVFSSAYYKSHFTGISTLQAGLESFWSSVSYLYGGYWDFRVVQDQNNNGQIAIMDNHSVEVKIKDVNPALSSTAKSTPSSPNRTFVFPLYSNRSMFKDFSLDVRMNAGMVSQAIYHSNKNYTLKGEETTHNPENLAIQALASLSNTEVAPMDANELSEEDLKKLKDEHVKDIHPIFVGDGKSGAQQVILKDGKLVVQNMPNDTRKAGTSKDEKDKQKQAETAEAKLAEQMKAVGEEPSTLLYSPDGELVDVYNKGLLYILNFTPDSLKNVSPLVPFSISFSMPGIGGIRLFDIFAVDYLPKRYREFGLFQVSGLEHELSTTGWTTKIEGTLRIDMDSMLAQVDPEQSEETKLVQSIQKTGNMNFVSFVNKQIENKKKQSQENSE
tara:strand:- start:2323 stop:4809 length:2487 start_codon:yes stop_codon:yes gene_type:complete